MLTALSDRLESPYLMKVYRSQDKPGSQHASDRLQDVQGLPTAARIRLDLDMPVTDCRMCRASQRQPG